MGRSVNAHSLFRQHACRGVAAGEGMREGRGGKRGLPGICPDIVYMCLASDASDMRPAAHVEDGSPRVSLAPATLRV